MKRLLEAAKKQALLSEGVGSNRNYRVGAILFDKRGNIHASKSNSYKTHPILASFTKYPHLHAESSCILHRGLDNCDGLSLLTVRVRNPNEQLTMAKPCKVCQSIIEKVGIKEVFYTDWNGKLICL